MTIVAAAVAALWAAPAAHASERDEPRIVVAPPSIEGGELGPDNLARVREALVEGLSRDGATVFSEAGEPCGDAQCAVALASGRGITHVITWGVTVDGRDYVTRLELRDADEGEILGASEMPCDICGIAEVAATVADQAAALRSKMEQVEVPPRLRVTSVPPGAQVFVDGTLAGVTPYDDELEAGDHEVEIQKEDFLPRTREVTLVDGVEQTVEVTLQRRPPEVEPARRGPGLRIGGAVAVGVGAAALITGATFLGLHHRPVQSQCSGGDMDPEGDCRLRYDGVPTGVPLVVAGALGVGAGIAMLVIDRKRGKRGGRRARVRPSGQGLAVIF